MQRNIRWCRKNPWFIAEVLPGLRQLLSTTLEIACNHHGYFAEKFTSIRKSCNTRSLMYSGKLTGTYD
jgi:hypothetical protein